MRFLSPLALAGLALVTLPVVIHLLVRRRALRLDFPSLRFLRETPSFRLRLRRIQQPLLLALRVAALILLVIGLARPLISFNSRTQRTRVILLDASLSMSAQGRAGAAREQARSIINNLTDGERACVIAFASDATLLSAVTSDRRELTAAVERYQATSGAANYAAGFGAADAVLQREPPGEASIDLISDFQESGFAQEQLAQISLGTGTRAQVVAHPVGARVERNAFLMDETVAATESGSEVSATEIVNGADERSGARRSWTIDANEGARGELEWRTEVNGQITARLRVLAPDEFDGDDERFLAFTPPRKGRALLVELDGDDAIPYLRAALEATESDVGQKRFMLERKSGLPPIASELNAYSLVALMLSRQPRVEEMRVLADYARAGGVVWLCMGRDVDTSAWNEFAKSEDGRAWPFASLARKDEGGQALSFGAADTDAPVLRLMEEQVFAALRAVRMREGYMVAPRDEALTMMRWNDGAAALVGAEVGSGMIVLLATSPARAAGELGISSAFPALASSIARYSLAPREPLARSIGEPVNLKLAPEALVKIVDAKGRSETVQARDLVMRPASFFREAGIYRVESSGLTKFLAFNAPVAESESALATADEIKHLFNQQQSATETSASAWQEATERQGNTWRYLLAAAFLLLVGELFVALRRQQGKIPDHELQDEREL
jgi:hypothetical protein